MRKIGIWLEQGGAEGFRIEIAILPEHGAHLRLGHRLPGCQVDPARPDPHHRPGDSPRSEQ